MKKEKIFTFLVVEDNPGDLLLIEDYLHEGFKHAKIVNARTHKEAVQLIEAGDVACDVILLDLSLPDKSGEALITDILAQPKLNCPVIILTGYGDVEFSVQSIALGISDYLLKDELSTIILYKSITYAKERWDFKLRIRESEKKFSLLFNLSPQPRWLYDCETFKFVQVNKIALEHYGYTKEAFLQMTPIELYPPELREEAKNDMQCADDDGEPLSGIHRHIKHNGEEIEVDLYSNLLNIDGRICRSVIAIDITEKARAELKLTQAIIKAQEEERYAIGSELHDNICQILTGSMLSLASVRSGLREDKLAVFNQGIESIKMASTEIRHLSHRLAPAFFDDINLKESFTDLLSSVQVAGRFETKVNFDPIIEDLPLKREIQINLYRILQEQLNNIIKYAGASMITVNLFLREGFLLYEIADNGTGFDEAKITKGIGFANMKRRTELFSGNFKITSNVNEGCRLEVAIPQGQALDN